MNIDLTNVTFKEDDIPRSQAYIDMIYIPAIEQYIIDLIDEHQDEIKIGNNEIFDEFNTFLIASKLKYDTTKLKFLREITKFDFCTKYISHGKRFIKIDLVKAKEDFINKGYIQKEDLFIDEEDIIEEKPQKQVKKAKKQNNTYSSYLDDGNSIVFE